VTAVTRAGGKEVYRLAFTFRGVQCRELVALPHSKANTLYCERLLAEVHSQIARGSFDYAATFPASRRARIFGHGGASRTIRAALEAYRDRTKATLELSTWNPYRRDIDNVLIPWCGSMRISEFRASDLRAWVGLQDLSLKRIRNILLPLRAVFAEALEDGAITANPLAAVRIAKLVPMDKRTSEYEPHPYSVADLVTLLGNLPVPERWAFQLWAFTGLRTGELIGLRWPRIDIEAKVLRVTETTTERVDKPRAKTKAGLRTIPLLPAALEAVLAMRPYTQLAGDRFTVNPRGRRDDQSWDTNKLASVWQLAHRGTGIEGRNPYQLRHTFASQLLSQGENPAHIARLLGHRGIEMVVRTYGRWVSEGEQLGFDRPARRYGMEPLWEKAA
jgi:integrase